MKFKMGRMFFLDATGYGSIRKLKTLLHIFRRHGIWEHPKAENIASYSSPATQFNYRFGSMTMNWAQRKIYLYNVTFGLYMLDPWERYLFNALIVVLMWFIFYNGYRNLNEICKRYVW